jgi:hypothetical protein
VDVEADCVVVGAAVSEPSEELVLETEEDDVCVGLDVCVVLVLAVEEAVVEALAVTETLAVDELDCEPLEEDEEVLDAEPEEVPVADHDCVTVADSVA